MTAAPLPEHEYARLMALARYEILDTESEESFDRTVRLAAHLLRTPSAFINFVDQFRQWNKAAAGAGRVTVPRSDSMCAWTILQDSPLVVEDARQDSRFRDNPLVTGEPHVQMYAGAPLITPSGHRIGTLCVTDSQPHPLSAADLQALQDLAAMVVTELELRIGNRQLERDLKAKARHNEELRLTLEQARVLEGVSGLVELNLAPQELTLAAAALLGDGVASDLTGLVLFRGETLGVQVAHSHARLSDQQRGGLGRLSVSAPGLLRELREASTPIYVQQYPGHQAAQPELVALGVEQVAWVPLGTRGGVTTLLLATRFRDHPVGGWRGSDRSLLEAAGRTIRSALDLRMVADLVYREARQDALTGVLNRRAFEEDLATWEAAAQPFSLALLDLDGLKGINDREGHSQGDKLLRIFAETLHLELTPSAPLYRLGGDEFVVLLPPEEADTFEERVDIAILAARQVVAGTLGVSVGIAHSSEAQGRPLLDLADSRMYAVKQRRQKLRSG
ncbi:sensor domain-containing diguanylate cyclase [Deinococcus cavernae]|uniref:Sensor domain-containing diguanylate cyclase n=1 Tax=Deinococcus cavernae TaxID=2320857 RepID=A0A418VGW6_9DEIO|nr:sensor domain-containing diguanylate cyclase [Deinococcus cavernae]RJF75334.1 sensor domain-containing diguanylate cyclase [Deinococcus cavernae]